MKKTMEKSVFKIALQFCKIILLLNEYLFFYPHVFLVLLTCLFIYFPIFLQFTSYLFFFISKEYDN